MIRSILFDIDGVLLSEERCFDASALAVWELLHSPNYLGIHREEFTPLPDEQTIRKIRSEVFCNDEILSLLKSLGLNSNWDMVFLTFFYQLINLLSELKGSARVEALDLLSEPLNQEKLQRISHLLPEKVQLDYGAFARDFESLKIIKEDLLHSFDPLLEAKFVGNLSIDRRSLWELGREVFQEWYVGDSFIEASIGKKARQEGKKGFLQEEIPLVSVDDINGMFKSLYEQGLELGIGTGRPAVETFEPLRALGFLQWVPEKKIVTSNDILVAESMSPKQGALGKPHPYTYLQSYYGKKKPAADVLSIPLPLVEGDSVLVVGDSVADFYAARAMGARFAAVLTGLTGENARSEFEELGADYILNNVLELVLLPERTGQRFWS